MIHQRRPEAGRDRQCRHPGEGVGIGTVGGVGGDGAPVVADEDGDVGVGVQPLGERLVEGDGVGRTGMSWVLLPRVPAKEEFTGLATPAENVGAFDGRHRHVDLVGRW